jgi:hypothetical protein
MLFNDFSAPFLALRVFSSRIIGSANVHSNRDNHDGVAKLAWRLGCRPSFAQVSHDFSKEAFKLERSVRRFLGN